jgi:hypothetical protein
MKKLMTLVMAVVALSGVYCGGKSGSQGSATSEKWPAEVTATLSENDVARLVKLLPVLDAALKADTWRPMRPKEGDGPVASLTAYVESMNLPGVDDSLKKAGSSWSEVRSMLYKTFAATTAVSMDGAPPEVVARIEEMRKDTSAAAKKAMKGYEAFKAAYSKIPAENKQVFAKHQQELQLLYTLGR